MSPFRQTHRARLASDAVRGSRQHSSGVHIPLAHFEVTGGDCVLKVVDNRSSAGAVALLSDGDACAVAQVDGALGRVEQPEGNKVSADTNANIACSIDLRPAGNERRRGQQAHRESASQT